MPGQSTQNAIRSTRHEIVPGLIKKYKTYFLLVPPQITNVTHSPLTHRQYHDFFVKKQKAWSFDMGKGYPQIQQDVGSRIRELREKRNHTQESLALKSGLDRTYINSVENGRRNISVQALDKIILALDYTFKSFFSCELFNTKGKH